MTIATTGSTGQLGRKVALLLSQAGVEQRLVVRDAARAPQLERTSVAVIAGYNDSASVRRALEGIDTLLMVSAAESADRVQQQKLFVDEAAEAGVKHIVYTSFQGAAPDSTFVLARDHYHTEEHIKATSSMSWTFLRDNFYIDFLSDMVGKDNVIRGPAGDGLFAPVAKDDVAAVAAAILQAPGKHRNMTYDLTGPDALTMADVAAIVSAHKGTTVTYCDETLDEAYASRQSYGAPDWQLEAWISTYTAIAAGELAQTSEAVLAVSGRPPMSLQQFLALS